MYVSVHTNSVVTRVGFDRRIYRVDEDEEYIAPVLTLDKPADCCVIIRAVLRGMTAESEFCSMFLDWVGKNGSSGHNMHPNSKSVFTKFLCRRLPDHALLAT